MDINKKYRCNQVMFIGDVVDHHAISFHAKHPECPGPNDEYLLALKQIGKWHKAFPRAKVCIGNHDDRILRLSESVNIPAKFLRNYSEIWKTPKWEWSYDFMIDNVYYTHGTGMSGIHPAYNAACKQLCSVVIGHCHARAGVKWRSSPQRRVFGMDTGCGIDVKAWQFAYGKNMPDRPVLGVGVVMDGIPYHEVMPMGKGEKYDNARFR